MKISLEEIKKVANQGPFYPEWDSLATYQVPNWFKGAKFGIFIHWGLYSLPAFGSEWYSRNMYIQGTAEFEHHVKTYGSHKDFGYKDFIPLFTAEKFQAEEWVQVFKEAGARYIFPVAEHHDGFQLYESQLSPFNSVEMGPKRDILQELKQATDQAHLPRIGLSIIFSFHMGKNSIVTSLRKSAEMNFIGQPCQSQITMIYLVSPILIKNF